MSERITETGLVIHQSGGVSPSFFAEKTAEFEAVDPTYQLDAYFLFEERWNELLSDNLVVPSVHPDTQLALEPDKKPVFHTFDIFSDSVETHAPYSGTVLSRLSSYVTLSQWDWQHDGVGRPGFVITHQCQQQDVRVRRTLMPDGNVPEPEVHDLAQIVLTDEPETSHTSFMRISPTDLDKEGRQRYARDVISFSGVNSDTLDSIFLDICSPNFAKMLETVRRQRAQYQRFRKDWPMRLMSRGERPLLSAL